ncbi:hypothetical protein [Archangium lansingense]|uniref:Lipoprotein n=1 Tax=Archangium lansingense TaxID=2995310 RepID=A0ABT4ABI2_9BACT|nr:hypothetical protein [Archangium lansinium]MCY1078985.1 hypothetical protein [Archangium lansinium]
MAMMKRFALIALGFVLGLFGAQLASELMSAKYDEQYGVLRKDISICELQQSGCSTGESFGGLMAGTPFLFRGDHVLEVRVRVAPSRVNEFFDLRGKEWGEKTEHRLLFE